MKSAKTILKKARKVRTDPYLALLEYRKTPTQGMDTSPVMQLMSRRTRTQLPAMPKLLKPSVDENVYQKIRANKDKQAANYNEGAKNLQELQKGDIVRFIPTGSLTKEAVKARVDKQVGMRSYEVVFNLCSARVRRLIFEHKNITIFTTSYDYFYCFPFINLLLTR